MNSLAPRGMQIDIVTPAPPRSRKGNRVTALRWARLLRSLGHRVRVAEAWQGRPCEILVALHARRSAASVERFYRAHRERPLIVALTGTDLYRDIRTHAVARRSLDMASRLVVLQPDGIRHLPERHRSKTRVIYQSVEPPRRRPPPLRAVFEACVIGHLRAVKDPFRAALAARRLPAASRVRIVHIGGALDPEMERKARAEEARNPRYRWLGELPRWKTLRLLARSRLLVLTSKMEGGANVISEALVAGVPVVSSRISGSIGLLGEDYPGFFEVGDTQGLAALMRRAEEDGAFYETLRKACARHAPHFAPARERESWRTLLAELISR